MRDVVNKPSHYMTYSPDPATYALRNDLPFWMGNVIKYVMRAGLKQYDNKDTIESEIIDLKKAMRYIDMRVNILEGKEEL